MNEPDIKWESEIHKVVPNYGMSRRQYPFVLVRKDGKPLQAQYRHQLTLRKAKEAAKNEEAYLAKTTDERSPKAFDKAKGSAGPTYQAF
jgi:hypothetical protein